MFKTAAVFSDHMVLQREKPIEIWGTGTDGEVIAASIGRFGAKASVFEGKWSVTLPPMDGGGPYCLKLSNGSQITEFTDVMIGEVWLAGGQSNMEFELKNSKDGERVLEQMKNSGVRFYNTYRGSHFDAAFYEEEEKTSWQVCSPETAGILSAVGYYFAEQLVKELDVTVGIISCNWGGTSASAWISRESLAEDPDTNTYNEEYEAVCKDRSYEEYLKQLADYNNWYEDWQIKVNKCYTEDPNILWSKVLQIAGDNLWPEPLGPHSPFRAGGVYETMLRRVCPYTLRGFIYYQGESDDHKPLMYGKLLTKLIYEWRRDWRDSELPFLFVQLPMFIGREAEDTKNWALIREQQMKVYQTVPHTGIAVVLDCGEFDEIHPKDKAPVGNRLAAQALLQVYHKDVNAFGPVFRSAVNDENFILVSFDHVGEGFVIQGEEAQGFELAGEDGNYVPALVEMEGDKIKVCATAIKNPKYVRYAWTNYGPVTVYNKEGLPLAPFRTDQEA